MSTLPVMFRNLTHACQYLKIMPALARGGSFRGRGNFFDDQMITPLLLNGKGPLPPCSAKAAASCGFTPFVLPAGSKMRGSCRLGAQAPLIRHLVVKKIPRALNDPSPGPARAWRQVEYAPENRSKPSSP